MCMHGCSMFWRLSVVLGGESEKQSDFLATQRPKEESQRLLKFVATNGFLQEPHTTMLFMHPAGL